MDSYHSCLEGPWKHLPIRSSWAVLGKPSSSFTQVYFLLNQNLFVLNCRNHNRKVISHSCHTAAQHCSEQPQHRTCFMPQPEHYSSFMARTEHPCALQAATAPIAQICTRALVLLHQHQPASQSISCSLLTTLAGGNDVVGMERKQQIGLWPPGRMGVMGVLSGSTRTRTHAQEWPVLSHTLQTHPLFIRQRSETSLSVYTGGNAIQG